MPYLNPDGTKAHGACPPWAARWTKTDSIWVCPKCGARWRLVPDPGGKDRHYVRIDLDDAVTNALADARRYAAGLPISKLGDQQARDLVQALGELGWLRQAPGVN